MTSAGLRAQEAGIHQRDRMTSQVDYRRLLYLDGDQVLNALCGIRLPEVENVIAEVMSAPLSDVGSSMVHGGKDLQFTGRSAKELRPPVMWHQTVHRALTALLVAIHYRIKRPPFRWEKLEEGDLVQFVAQIQVRRSTTVQAALAAEQQALAERTWMRKLLDVLFGRPRTDGPLEVLRAEGLGTHFIALAAIDAVDGVGTPTLILQLESRNLLVDSSTLARRVTILAEIDVKPSTGTLTSPEEVIAIDEDSWGTVARVAPAVRADDQEPTWDAAWDLEDEERGNSESLPSRRELLLRPIFISKQGLDGRDSQ